MTDLVDRSGIAQIHELLLDGLATVDRILTQADCPYFLAYGTALGARRGKAFIPWDVDADLYLHFASRGRALDALDVGLAGSVWSVEHPGNAGYEYLFPRIVLRGVHHTLIRIDLFPLNAAPESALGQRLLTGVQRVMNKAYMLKRMPLGERRHYGATKLFAARAARALLAVVPADLIRLGHDRLVAAMNARLSGRVLGNTSGSYGSREYYDAEWFSRSVRSELDGVDLNVGIGADAYLAQVYGDYLSEPPASQIRAELEFATQHYVTPLRDAGVIT